MAIRHLVTKTLEKADVLIDGDRPWDVQVHNVRFYRRALRGSLGLGESYIDGDWDVESIDALFRRLLGAAADSSMLSRVNRLLHDLGSRISNCQNKRRSRAVAEQHYDLDHRMYQQFLGPWNQYTCCFFKDTEDLREAEEIKLEMICKKLELDENDRVLDIGCGWGGFARYAATTRGCEVTGVTISAGQAAFAREFTAGLPVDIVEADYRDLPRLLDMQFDKIMICGMIEHVGYKNYRTLMQVVHKLLARDGLFLLHTIGNCDDTTIVDPWIEKYIFRNSMAPSMPQLARAVQGLFSAHDWENYGLYYSKTLAAWQARFEKNWNKIKALTGKQTFDERFRRMWNYYLLSCKAAFDLEQLLLWQIVLAKSGTRSTVLARVMG